MVTGWHGDDRIDDKNTRTTRRTTRTKKRKIETSSLMRERLKNEVQGVKLIDFSEEFYRVFILCSILLSP